mmetsp:Transcript_25455/g.70111  ORF Transcript_25455/g.70111 Transcript_25455/m.70111 type:complete len:231 (-) Transcript_25455:693-1385(-)
MEGAPPPRSERLPRALVPVPVRALVPARVPPPDSWGLPSIDPLPDRPRSGLYCCLIRLSGTVSHSSLGPADRSWRPRHHFSSCCRPRFVSPWLPGIDSPGSSCVWAVREAACFRRRHSWKPQLPWPPLPVSSRPVWTDHRPPRRVWTPATWSTVATNRLPERASSRPCRLPWWTRVRSVLSSAPRGPWLGWVWGAGVLSVAGCRVRTRMAGAGAWWEAEACWTETRFRQW